MSPVERFAHDQVNERCAEMIQAALRVPLRAIGTRIAMSDGRTAILESHQIDRENKPVEIWRTYNDRDLQTNPELLVQTIGVHAK